MLLVESDLPAGGRGRELDAGGRGLRGGRRDVGRSRRPTRRGRLAAPGPPARATGARAAGHGPDGGRRRAARPRARAARRDPRGSAQKHGVRIATFGHAGDGNLHPNFIFDRDDPRAEELTEAVRIDLYRAAIALGGTVTAEHGSGSSRRASLVEQVGPDVLRVMQSIKTALDPLGLLNPGKVL